MSTDNTTPDKPKMDVYSGVRWSAFSKYGAQGMQFVISLALARILAPEYFGLLGMATVVTGFVKIFRNLGFNTAIVQRKQISDDLLSTLFWVNLGVCIFVGLIALGMAPVAAWMYDDPRVTPIIAVLSITFAFAGFTMVPSAMLQRRMEFKKLAVREIGGIITSGCTALPLAYFGWGVWALVGSTLANSFSQMVLLNLAMPFRPRLVIDRLGLRECLGFGLNLTGFNIFNYFARNADNLIIGVFLGPIALGYYSLAYKLMLLPRDSITNTLTRVLFPKLSKIQDDDTRLIDIYLRACNAIALITFPVMSILAIIADPFVNCALGVKWTPAISLIQILAPIGALQSVWSITGQVLLAKGRADWYFRQSLVRSVVFVLSFLAGVPWGVSGVTVAYGIACVAWTPVAFRIASAQLPHLSTRRILENLIPATLVALAVASITFVCFYGAAMISSDPTFVLTMSVGAGLAAYATVIVLLASGPTKDICSVLRRKPSAAFA